MKNSKLNGNIIIPIEKNEQFLHTLEKIYNDEELSVDEYNLISDFVEDKQGINFIYGPTHSGKTEYLNSKLDQLVLDENAKILIIDTNRIGLYRFNDYKNVTYVMDNYLKQLNSFDGNYIFIDEIFSVFDRGFKKALMEKVKKEKIYTYVTSQVQYFSKNDLKKVTLIKLKGYKDE